MSESLATLAFDCATGAASVAVRLDGVTLVVRDVSGRNHAEAMLPAIADAVACSGLVWERIGLIAVTVGPGRFTGLRIGLAAARGLALARRIPIAGVSTADLLAAQVAPGALAGRRLLVAIDSRREDHFVQLFDENRRVLDELRALDARQALARYGGAMLVVGDAAPAFLALRPDLEVAPSRPWADALAGLAERRRANGLALTAEPLYLRPPDAALPS